MQFSSIVALLAAAAGSAQAVNLSTGTVPAVSPTFAPIGTGIPAAHPTAGFSNGTSGSIPTGKYGNSTAPAATSGAGSSGSSGSGSSGSSGSGSGAIGGGAGGAYPSAPSSTGYLPANPGSKISPELGFLTAAAGSIAWGLILVA